MNLHFISSLCVTHRILIFFSDRINEEHGNKIKEVEHYWQSQVSTLHKNLEIVKEQMERESQQKIETLIQQHRSELGK